MMLVTDVFILIVPVFLVLNTVASRQHEHSVVASKCFRLCGINVSKIFVCQKLTIDVKLFCATAK
jgi:hypothetical protein